MFGVLFPFRAEEKERAKVQPGEQLDLPPFDCKVDKPMMEMEAGSNVWYQASIVRETANEIRVLFPGTESCSALLTALTALIRSDYMNLAIRDCVNVEN